MQHAASALGTRTIPPGRFAHPVSNIDMLDIEPGMHVADFGAGSGAYALAIAKRVGEHGKLIAVDIQKDLLHRIHAEAAQHSIRNITVVWADLEKHHAVKMADHSLDVVLISNLLFQLEDKKAPLKEARRLLKDGGRLAVIDWSDSYGGMGPIRQHVFTKEAAQALAEGEGFAVLREFPAGAHHWGLVARAKGATDPQV